MENINDDADIAVEAVVDAGALSLVPSLTIANVAEFYQVCQAALQTSDPLVIDGGVVAVIDGAGLQLISCCVRDAIERGREVRWRQVSDALLKSSATMGLSSELAIELA